MKRYFYTDPLAAAWMAKCFGMRFENSFTMDFDYYDAQTRTCHLRKDTWPANLYIHPDSLRLLEPKHGDFVTGDIMYTRTMESICGITRESRSALTLKTQFQISWVESDERHDYRGHTKIIQRNGVAFMWPESEEV